MWFERVQLSLVQLYHYLFYIVCMGTTIVVLNWIFPNPVNSYAFLNFQLGIHGTVVEVYHLQNLFLFLPPPNSCRNTKSTESTWNPTRHTWIAATAVSASWDDLSLGCIVNNFSISAGILSKCSASWKYLRTNERGRERTFICLLTC